MSAPLPVVPKSSMPATSEANRIQRVQWMHLVMIVFTKGPISLSSTALKWKLMLPYHETPPLGKLGKQLF